MRYGAGLAVHQVMRADDLAAESFAVIAWCPRQTPRMGATYQPCVCVWRMRGTSTFLLRRECRPGPGESRMRSGCRASTLFYR